MKVKLHTSKLPNSLPAVVVLDYSLNVENMYFVFFIQKFWAQLLKCTFLLQQLNFTYPLLLILYIGVVNF